MSPAPRARLGEAEAREVILTDPAAYTMALLRSWMAAGPGREARLDCRAALPVPADLRRPPAGDPAEGSWGARSAPGWAGVAETTVGRVVASAVVFSRSRELRACSPFLDAPWDKGAIARMERDVGDALLDGRISPEDAAWFVDRMQWLGYAPTSFVAPSMTADTIRLPPGAAGLKAGILAGPRGDAMRAGDLAAVAAAEADILAAARSELRGADPGMEIYDAGARGSFGNNYKNTAVMRGAMRKSDDPSVIHVSTASLSEGIPPAEMPNYADLIVQASYGRSVMTRDGGYIAKQLNAAFQGLALDPDPESDCRTPLLLRVEVDDPREYLYRFYRAGASGPLEQVMPLTCGALKGRQVMMRTPMYCGGSPGVCSRCAGTLYYRMGVQQWGLLSSRIGTVILNNALKSFHDTTLKISKIQLSEYVKELTPSA